MDTTPIVQAIDAEIDRLSKARALLTGHTGPLKRGFTLSGDATVPKRRKMSAEGRGKDSCSAEVEMG